MLPYPNITAREPAQQLRELKNYLCRLVEQLNLLLAEEKEEANGT